MSDYEANGLTRNQGNGSFVVRAPDANGVDDTAALIAAIQGSGSVYLQPGGHYVVPLETSWPAFTGVIYGQGATISFTYGGVYHAAKPINAWTDTTVRDTTFTAPGAQLAAIFGAANAGLFFRRCTVIDCTPTFTLPIVRDLSFTDGKLTQSGAVLAQLQQRIGFPNSGKFVFERNVVDFAPVASGGSILGGTDTALTATGATLTIRANDMFARDAAGYTIDAAIDVEPSGATPYDLVTIEANLIYNASIYIGSANRTNVKGNRWVYTANAGGGSMTPWKVFNNNGSHPATGVVSIDENSVLQNAVAGAYTTQILTATGISGDEIRCRRNKAVVNGASTNPQPAYNIGATYNLVRIEDDVAQAGGTAQSSVPVVSIGVALAGKVRLLGGRIAGTWQHLIAYTQSSFTTELLEIRDVDMQELTISGGRYAQLKFSSGVVFTRICWADNPGLNPVGLLAAPAIPASGVAQINNQTWAVDAFVVVTGGSVTNISIGGTATGQTSGGFQIPQGQSITLTYTVAPTWTWFGL